MTYLDLHKVELVQTGGHLRFEKVAQSNREAIFSLSTKYVSHDLEGFVYSWCTGYSAAGLLQDSRKPQGKVYAPEGFNTGKLAFVTDDPFLRIHEFLHKPAELLEVLKKIEDAGRKEILRPYWLIGEIINIY